MIRYNKPTKPIDFEEKVKEEKKKAEVFFSNPANLAASSVKHKFTSKWGTFKHILINHQHKKCGYCEQRITVAPGDVEHYRPKGKISRLPNPGSFGEEQANNTVKGRKPKKESDRGYWWLAYEWENYLLACDPCNQRWKGTIFPVKDDEYKIDKNLNSQEKALLLHPFDQSEDPESHLEFTIAGGIRAKNGSEKGQKTIETCGLNRPSLLDERIRKVRDIAILIRSFRETHKNFFLKQIFLHGREDMEFAGLVRWMFQNYFSGIPWTQLEEMFKNEVIPIDQEIVDILG